MILDELRRKRWLSRLYDQDPKVINQALLASKFFQAPPAQNQVERVRLRTSLNEGLQAAHPLTLVSAPAGYGKSTLVAEWIRRVKLPVTWLSLDEADDDPLRFFLYLIATADSLGTLAAGYIGLQFTSNVAHGPAQGLMHDRVPLSRMGFASGVKNFLDMAGMVLSALVMGRLIAAENPDIVPAVALVAGLWVAGLLVVVFGVREAASGARPPTR